MELSNENIEVESLEISDDGAIGAIIVFNPDFDAIEKFGTNIANLYCTYYPRGGKEDTVWCEAIYESDEWSYEAKEYYPTETEEELIMQLIVDAVRKETNSTNEFGELMVEYLNSLK